jgi:sensor histidine kinase regulating citrate/malate metabolism
MFTSLGARITLTLMVVLSAAVALLALLSFNKYQKALEELVEARYRFVLQDVAQTLELSLDLRIPLNELSSLQGVLERRRAANADMQYIEIFDAEGRILFSSDRSTIGDVLPEHWVQANLWAGEGAWRRVDEDGFVLGLPLRTSFSQTIGGVVLAYAKAPIQEQLSTMAWQLLRNCALTVVLFALLLLGALQLLLRGPRRRLKELRAMFEGLPARPPAPGALEPLALAAGQAVAAGAAALDAAAAELQRLDQEP